MGSTATNGERTGTTTAPYRVLIAGGCYAGLSAAINLLEKCDTIESPIPVEVTIVDERDGFYHLIGSPLALANRPYAEKAWVDYKDVKILQRPNVRFVHGSLTGVDCAAKTATISEQQQQHRDSSNNQTTTTTPPTPTPTPTTSTTEVRYDFFVAATGLRRAWPVVPQSLSREAYLREAGAHIDRVTSLSGTAAAPPVLVVGGGAVGIEMAAELKHAHPGVRVTLAHSRGRLLSAEPLPDTVKDCALELTREAGVEVLLDHRLADCKKVVVARDHNDDKDDDKNDKSGGGGAEETYEVTFENGRTMRASQVVMAMSKSVPSTGFLPAAALSPEGLVRVRPSMQFAEGAGVANAEAHFAVGDVICWSGIKRCGAAMHEGKFAALNIHQIMLQEQQQQQGQKEEEPSFSCLEEIPPMIGLAVGSNAVSYGPEGMNYGPQVMQRFFEDDLGFRICWDYLRLGGETA
ncbi:FAD/NAD(P)-binding domain-containing protein [Xylariaceae sp. FL0804]|nr:FAD/NAD(P)-binding domain-containing protein [Xylariaceae sp. FL0804]